MRPTQVGSVPTTSAGVGNSASAGLSNTSTPGASRSTSRASSTSTSRPKRACTESEWVVITGTRTQVAETFRFGRFRILRDSLRTFSSSEDQPSSFSEPAQGTTFIASGAGNGPKALPTTRRTSPGVVPSSRLPATFISWSYSASMPS
jgi:hypothetical protein